MSFARFIPGPPCGNAGVRDTGNAEGFVHVHAGVHGIGDLVAADHDWRNPVAKITIRTNTRPTILTVDESGSGPGVITDALGALVNASNPAQRGQVVVVYANDLGPTDPPVRAGEVTPFGTFGVGREQRDGNDRGRSGSCRICRADARLCGTLPGERGNPGRCRARAPPCRSY